MKAPYVTPDPFEQHFTPQEIASRLKIDQSTVRRKFQDQPGVVKIGRSDRRDGKRDYVSLRIPESVFRRVYGELVGAR
jgi:predicted transcriptional regulator